MCISAAATGPALGQSQSQQTCAASALTDYTEAKIAFLKQLTPENPLPSPEEEIAQRRLEEQYCERFTQCYYGQSPEPVQVLPYRAAFSGCLRDEALDKYAAPPLNLPGCLCAMAMERPSSRSARSKAAQRQRCRRAYELVGAQIAA
jgi:hypothetical protein